MRRYVNPANLITSASLAAGIVALMLASAGHLREAAAMVALAAVLDGLDGLVARRLGLCGRFGCNLDSLADMVTFGVTPALMLHHGPLASSPVAGGAACVLFAVGGAWRLARFPLVEHQRHWVGLPIPTAGILAAVAAVLGVADWAAILVALALTALMVSTVPFPTLATLARRPPRRRAPASEPEAPRAEPDAPRAEPGAASRSAPQEVVTSAGART
jgi:CDP-diacylglycerol---serine O-phosphatidyltransferase